MNVSMNDRALYEDADRWRELTMSPPLREKIDTILSVIPRHVRSIADVGCGNGLIANELKNQFHVIGIDRSLTALRLVEPARLCASIDRLPVKDESIDLVLCSEVLEHLPNRVLDGALKELSRITKEFIIIVVPNNEYLHKNDVKCIYCNFIFNSSYHIHSFNLTSLYNIFNDFELIQYFLCGDHVRQYNPFLMYVRQRLANKWTQLREPRKIRCPSCRQYAEYHYKPNMISLLIDGFNSLILRKRPYWLGMLLKK